MKDENEVTDLLQEGVRFYEQIVEDIYKNDTGPIYRTIFCEEIDDHAPLLYDGVDVYKIKMGICTPGLATFIDNIMSALKNN